MRHLASTCLAAGLLLALGGSAGAEQRFAPPSFQRSTMTPGALTRNFDKWLRANGVEDDAAVAAFQAEVRGLPLDTEDPRDYALLETFGARLYELVPPGGQAAVDMALDLLVEVSEGYLPIYSSDPVTGKSSASQAKESLSFPGLFSWTSRQALIHQRTGPGGPEALEAAYQGWLQGGLDGGLEPVGFRSRGGDDELLAIQDAQQGGLGVFGVTH